MVPVPGRLNPPQRSLHERKVRPAPDGVRAPAGVGVGDEGGDQGVDPGERFLGLVRARTEAMEEAERGSEKQTPT